MKFISIIALAWIFWFIQNQYFGWNVRPMSDAEVLADGIVFIIAAIALTKL